MHAEGEERFIPQDVCAHGVHEGVAVDVAEVLVRSIDPRIGEHDVQSSVFRQRFINDAFHCHLVCSVKLPGVNVDFGVEGLKLPLMDCKVFVVEIAYEDSTSAILGKLMGAGAADTQRRVCACWQLEQCKLASWEEFVKITYL